MVHIFLNREGDYVKPRNKFGFLKLNVREDKVQLMKGLICNRPAPGLIRIKERSSEVCEFQRPRHLFFFFCRLAITRCLHIVGSFFSTWKPFTAPPSAYGRVVWNDIKATTLKFKCGKWHLLVSQGGIWKKAFILLHSKHLKRAVYLVCTVYYTVCTSWMDLD